MIFVAFIFIAAITVIAAVFLSTFADTIGEKTALGGLFVGTIFLAGATSLPEVTTSVSASVLGNANLAVGNILGSNMFNLLLLASFDLFYRKKHLFEKVDNTHFYTASIGLLLTMITLLFLTVQLHVSFFTIGVDVWLIIFVYLMLIFSMPRTEKSETPLTKKDDHTPSRRNYSLRFAIIGFIIAAFVIMGAGTLLTITGDRIAVITGLGASFIGTFLIAATTSLPEGVSVIVALRIRNYNLAFGSVLGSNIFNLLILILADLFYSEGPILSAVSTVHKITAAATGVLFVIILYSLSRPNKQTVWRYTLPSLLLITIYFVSSYLIYIQ